MNIKTLFFIGLLSVLAVAPSAADAKAPQAARKNAEVPQGPKIKVVVAKDVPSALVEAKGNFCVIRKDTGSVLSRGSGGKRFVMHALQDGLRWGEEYPDVYQVLVVPQSADTLLYVNGIQYKGAIAAYHVRDNRVTIVNEVALEDYVKSVLAFQVEAAYSKEAMAALAISARTEAYARVLGSKGSLKPWDVSADEAGYQGFGITLQPNGADEAVDLTRFMVMESTKQEGPLQNAKLAPEKAEALAKHGFDAQKILKSTFSHIKIGVTVHPDELAQR
jgi:hypothetical protein